MYYFMDSGPKSSPDLFGWTRKESHEVRSHIFPILDILSRSGDIRDQIRKLCKIGPNFACVWPAKFFGGEPPEFLDKDYLIGADTDHVVKFRGDQPRYLGDPLAN